MQLFTGCHQCLHGAPESFGNTGIATGNPAPYFFGLRQLLLGGTQGVKIDLAVMPHGVIGRHQRIDPVCSAYRLDCGRWLFNLRDEKQRIAQQALGHAGGTLGQMPYFQVDQAKHLLDEASDRDLLATYCFSKAVHHPPESVCLRLGLRLLYFRNDGAHGCGAVGFSR